MAKADEADTDRVSPGIAFTAPLIARLEQLQADPAFRDDHHALYCCRLALDALEQGNYGVAAILTDPQGAVVAQSENQVFSATHDNSDGRGQRFSSRAHAEMLLIDQLEANLIAYSPQQLTMLVSLEPCPMCLARLLLSGIGSVRYIAADPHGGMLHRLDKLPPAWRNLSQLQSHYQAHVSAPVRQLAIDISSANLPVLREKLLKHIRP